MIPANRPQAGFKKVHDEGEEMVGNSNGSGREREWMREKLKERKEEKMS